ncbi:MULTISPECIES: GNAT family N-acetyltransferase [Haloferacaceae]|uniref:GNAT family N-acetyltransferase n=1 Tax=Halorubrum glutamatedens TaxID=2707018 RepID=A0ABD5QMB4_9EURY|nr:GNAT family N-acetyltransferase [Halobellus captivus]
MGLSSRTLWTLRRYWADRLGVPPNAFEKSGGTAGSAEEGGIQLFSHGDSLVVGVPDPLLDAAEDRSETVVSLDTEDEDAVHGWLTRFDGIEQAIGPTFYGYVDRETFTPVESDARVLTAADTAAYQAFQRSIPDSEWDQGGTQFTPGETVGLFVDGELVAVAGFDVWEGLLAHLAVVTHPNYRGHGYGQIVVSQATERAFADGLLPQYRTSDAWPWSVALAQDLGFHRFATAYFGVYQQ